MKNCFRISFLLLTLFIFCGKVNAEEGADLARSWLSGESTKYQSLDNKFSNSSFVTYQVLSSDRVLVYGKSECNFVSNTCSYQYQGNKSVPEILSESVICLNGEKYVSYTFLSSTASDFKENFNSQNHNIPAGVSEGSVVWSEQYYVQCTNENSGTVVDLEATSSDQENSNDNDNNNNTIDGSSSSNSDYTSSTTEQSPETGVETYYIILGLIAVISYLVMTFVKKRNLFKNI